ncbi:DUF760 domain-containing protein [Chloropicon primus]|nr:DUF760 domain-containing protein [Chloropicon primus]UPQ98752.1 DUF760 domain-containing protein [Chloropicon primus]|eukprot:QDZ19540.1 DUF760 domain-containing protein [Chloropicon primus]
MLPAAPRSCRSSRAVTRGRKAKVVFDLGRGRAEYEVPTTACCATGEGGEEGEKSVDLVYKPQTPAGEMLSYYLSEQPHLFQDAVDEQLRLLETEKEEIKDKKKDKDKSDPSEMVLYQRMDEVRDLEMTRNLEDLMYFAVVERFTSLGVSMLSPLNDVVDIDGNSDLENLTKGVHSVESLEMVRSHLMQVLSGPTGSPPPNLNSVLKISKLQAAQVYAASVMFGYFLRRVDARFQLEKAMGLLNDINSDAVERLENIFGQASAAESWDEDAEAFVQSRAEQPKEVPVAKPRSKLQEYIETFDQQTLQETAQILSKEGSTLVERQTRGLFGDINELQEEIKRALGDAGNDVLSSPEDLLLKLQEVIASGEVKSLTLTVAAQRRVVLEAVAFGAFLRDIENYVAKETVGLLTGNNP